MANTTRFEIFSQWLSSDGSTSVDRTGVVVEATDADEALVAATRRGTASGLGAVRTYVGLVAIKVPS